jgi:hypothetical protein
MSQLIDKHDIIHDNLFFVQTFLKIFFALFNIFEIFLNAKLQYGKTQFFEKKSEQKKFATLNCLPRYSFFKIIVEQFTKEGADGKILERSLILRCHKKRPL